MLTALAAGLCANSRVAAQPHAASEATNTPNAKDAPDGSDANSARAMEVEKLALQILAVPSYKKATAKALRDFKDNEYAGKPDFLRYARSATDEAAMDAAMLAATGGVPEPVFMWNADAPRKWHGYYFPGTRWYADNTDTFYRFARVYADSSYEIMVKVDHELPAQLSLLTYDSMMHETGVGEQPDVSLSSIEITKATPRNA